jgi:hypothetical protein
MDISALDFISGQAPQLDHLGHLASALNARMTIFSVRTPSRFAFCRLEFSCADLVGTNALAVGLAGNVVSSACWGGVGHDRGPTRPRAIDMAGISVQLLAGVIEKPQ